MQNTSRLLVVSVFYLLSFTLCYPLYQYLFDADGIGYMMVAKRLAWGDYANAINRCWSPLHSWLIAPFYKGGIDVFTAFKVSDGIIGLGILVWLREIRLVGKYATTANGNHALLGLAAYINDYQLYMPTKEANDY